VSSPATAARPSNNRQVRAYWNAHIHDLAITTHPVGSAGFFSDLDQYHFEKLHHLERLIPFEGLAGLAVLDVGCGAGVDLVRFARGGAHATGVDLAESAIHLASDNLAHQALRARLAVADGEALPFPDQCFDYVFAHGIVQYTENDRRVVEEVRRVLRPGGTAVFQAYNRISWLNALSKLMKVDLEHEHAPVLRKYSPAEFRRLVDPFAEVTMVYERFPVKSRLHKGWKGAAFNTCFVGTFNALPRSWVERYGWHLLAFCRR
jgi:ubiquinone/menaquinone biosynthesis C-methylase UbiE